jgi:protein phosphatase
MIMHVEVENWSKKACVASVGEYSALIDEAKVVLEQEIALREGSGLVLVVPQAVKGVIVVGDIHGDMESLVHILKAEDMEKADRIIFLGDYGDRGGGSVEVYYLLLMLKVSVREKVIMLRGNHEGPMLVRPHDLPSLFTKRYGAKGNTLYKKLKELWAYLPHVVLVEGRYLLLHGGLPRNVASIKDIAYAHETASSNFEEILWSDPVEGKGYFHSLRGAGMMFGENVTDKVLRAVGVKTLIRSHEPCEGVKVQQQGRILTLFSRKGAPYFNTRAAYLVLDENALREAKDAAKLVRDARIW